MFDSPNFPKSLHEDLFEDWLESGRESKISYKYLLVIWDALEDNYRPVYIENRADIEKYEKFEESTGQESLIAAYDLFSESRIV